MCYVVCVVTTGRQAVEVTWTSLVHKLLRTFQFLNFVEISNVEFCRNLFKRCLWLRISLFVQLPLVTGGIGLRDMNWTELAEVRVQWIRLHIFIFPL